MKILTHQRKWFPIPKPRKHQLKEFSLLLMSHYLQGWSLPQLSWWRMNQVVCSESSSVGLKKIYHLESLRLSNTLLLIKAKWRKKPHHSMWIVIAKKRSQLLFKKVIIMNHLETGFGTTWTRRRQTKKIHLSSSNLKKVLAVLGV